MALIKCIECGKEISDKAAACPHCGCPNISAEPIFENRDSQKIDGAQRKKPKKKILLGTAIIVACAIVAFLMFFRVQTKTSTQTTYTVEIDGQVYHANSQEEVDAIIDEHIYGDLNKISSSGYIDTDETGKAMVEIEAGECVGISGNYYNFYFKVRNTSDVSVHTIGIDIDILDKNGDIISTTHPQTPTTLQPGQAINIDALAEIDNGGVSAVVSGYSLNTTDGDHAKGHIKKSPKIGFTNVEEKNDNANESSVSALSAYTYDEYRMYCTMLLGFNELMDSLKNPNSAQFLGIAYNPDADVAYFCVIAENDFGGNTKSYISYGGTSKTLYESDDHKYNYDSASIHRSLDDLMLFIDAVKNAEDADVPQKQTNKALEAYSSEQQQMFSLVIAGIDELEALYDDLIIIGHKYSTEQKTIYFWFGGEGPDGKSAVTYASYTDSLGIMASDAYKDLYDSADIDIYSFEIDSYKDAAKKDISK